MNLLHDLSILYACVNNISHCKFHCFAQQYQDILSLRFLPLGLCFWLVGVLFCLFDHNAETDGK